MTDDLARYVSVRFFRDKNGKPHELVNTLMHKDKPAFPDKWAQFYTPDVEIRSEKQNLNYD